MKHQVKIASIKLYLILFGIAFGLFAGFIITIILRIIFDLLFGWGDSGPAFVNLIIIAAFGVTIYFSIKIITGWGNDYLRKKGLVNHKD